MATLPKIELPKIELPKVELPKLELPKVELPKIERPTVASVKAQIADARKAVAGFDAKAVVAQVKAVDTKKVIADAKAFDAKAFVTGLVKKAETVVEAPVAPAKPAA